MAELDLAQVFREESHELLAELEELLLAVESDPGDMACVATIFRVMHTLKGSGGMAGFEELVRFTHQVETVFDRVRTGQLSIDHDLLTLTLAAKDHIQSLIGAGLAPDRALVERSDVLLAGFQPFLGKQAPAQEVTAEEQRETAVKNIFWIRFMPDAHFLASGSNPLGMITDLSELGVISMAFRPGAIPPLEEMDPHLLYGWWDVICQGELTRSDIDDVFMFLGEADRVFIHEVGAGCLRKSDLDDFLNLLGKEPGNEEALVAKLTQACTRIHEEKRARRAVKDVPVPVGGVAGESSSIRVDAARLDQLVDMVGELVIIQSRLTMGVRHVADAALSQIAEDLERLTDEMRDSALGLRMVPIGVSFGGLRRLVRDLSNNLGKQVQLVTKGAETELDKTVIDRLKDPLMHILRNAMDHGIEDPQDRLAAGKPTEGNILLRAGNASGDVIITIRDDGRGIDPEKVRRKGIDRGLIAADADLSDKELFALLFEPGFSTADKVSNISGRGVGMDVVKKSIDALRGSVEIDSKHGEGTTIRVQLPLTLAIIDGLLVQIGPESFIIPLATVEACQERFINGHVRKVDSIERNGHLIPCVSLRRLMEVPGEQPGYERVIIASLEDNHIGLAVDKVIGRQQAVVKRLEGVYRNLDWVSGTTINGDGGISLILDVMQLVRFAQAQDTSAIHSR